MRKVKRANIGTRSSEKLRAKLKDFKFMISKLSSNLFGAQISTLFDIIERVTELSLKFQSDGLQPFSASDYIEECVGRIGDLATTPGPSSSSFLNENPITDEEQKELAEFCANFHLALQEAFFKRFHNNAFLKQLAFLNPSKFPKELDKLRSFGNTEVVLLAQRFFSREVAFAIDREYQAFKKNKNVVGENLMKLFKIIDILPLSSASCERGFSLMNITWSKERSSFDVDTVRDLLTIRINGPAPDDFEVGQLILEWLKQHRDATDRNDSNQDKRKNQRTESDQELRMKRATKYLFCA